MQHAPNKLIPLITVWTILTVSPLCAQLIEPPSNTGRTSVSEFGKWHAIGKSTPPATNSNQQPFGLIRPPRNSAQSIRTAETGPSAASPIRRGKERLAPPAFRPVAIPVETAFDDAIDEAGVQPPKLDLPPLPDPQNEQDSAHTPVPSTDDDEPLPPLAEELWNHGGSYLYEPEGDRLNWPPADCDEHYDFLRLPESWEKPRPLTAFAEFLGADAIHPRPGLKWFGENGSQWEPRLVVYGSYELFGVAVEDSGQRTDGVGHQALLDIDFRLTGTERFHMQFRPLGEKNSGGSFYQFNNPSGYQNNSTGVPDRWWFEGELRSIFGGLIDYEFTPRDYHVVVGKFPFVLHNNLLMNDDIIGIAVNKNSIMPGRLSNLNVQLFYGFDDVDGFGGANLDVAGIHTTADYRHALIESTFASAHNSGGADLDAYYAALSATKFFGPYSLAGRVLSKWEDAGSRGDGQLYVLESNLNRVPSNSFQCATGIERAIFYCNAFKATSGWNSISGGNFDRLRSTFEVNPLVQVSRGARVDDTIGVSLGVQLFRHHEDESFIPEIVWEEIAGEAVYGGGLRYQRKVGRRTYIQLQGIKTWSDDRTLQREGVFFSTFFAL
ncbi:MAG: hypothetical protein HON53_21180 [Planctomycetaceae bacterium]|jgi:hypothetical protein|nr:hypothetical protein [Planctomycetaceae bacterium]MBT6156502.1 hypothetical protein [Planctomycetaceae bacterium]MBT6485420.1 hypothetical protein [Planctomycetaceae bacterium]MBT6497216.1 hypothetical protein [Planctomycetaceae bacterium]